MMADPNYSGAFLLPQWRLVTAKSTFSATLVLSSTELSTNPLRQHRLEEVILPPTFDANKQALQSGIILISLAESARKCHKVGQNAGTPVSLI